MTTPCQCAAFVNKTPHHPGCPVVITARALMLDRDAITDAFINGRLTLEEYRARNEAIEARATTAGAFVIAELGRLMLDRWDQSRTGPHRSSVAETQANADEDEAAREDEWDRQKQWEWTQ